MMRYRIIPPKYLDLPIREFADISPEDLHNYNEEGYGIYYTPNYASNPKTQFSNGSDIDNFEWIFIDMDLKDGVYKSKQEFADVIRNFPLSPTKTISTGHGVHVYWHITDLTRDSYLQLQKRLIKKFNTDDSVWTLMQLLRVEGYYNTKEENNWIEVVRASSPELNSGNNYTVVDFDDVLAPLTDKDSKDIVEHIDKVINKKSTYVEIDTENIPEKFLSALEKSDVLKKLFYEPEDRSVCDMKIANMLYFYEFSREEALASLVHTDKAKERGVEYARAIINKVYDNPPNKDEINGELFTPEEIDALNRENYAYKVIKENERVKRAKEVDKKRGKFFLKDSENHRVQQFAEYTEKDINSLGKHLPFICKKLSDTVALSAQDYIFIGGNTGLGKSSIAANIIMPVIDTGKKVLVLSTEESASEIIKRCMALSLKYDYNDERNWTSQQRLNCVKKYEELATKLVVVDYMYETADMVRSDLTTLEGLENVLTCTENDGYDLIVVDYLTKITTSATNPSLNFYTVVDSAAKFLEEHNKRTRIPIVAFGQIKTGEKDQDFKERIRNAKSIMEYVTSAIEISTDKEANITTLIFHKMRKMPPNFEGKIDLRFDKGKYREI